MDPRLGATPVLMTIFMVAAEGVRLYPCPSSMYRDVIENSTVTFHCDQYSGRVEWRYKRSQNATLFPVSICNKTHCTASVEPRLTPAYISANNSSLTTTLTSRNVGVAGGEYKCDNNICRMHILVPASVSKPTSFITRTDQGFSLHCQTRITKVYSSKGQYSCEWQNGRTRVAGTLNLQPPPHDTNNTSDRMGTCDVTLQLSNLSDAICNVTVSPGNTVASSVIVLPSHPEISCPTRPVCENTNITCTCTTDNLGQPGGRLVWYAGSNGVFDREIVRGNFDLNILTMTWPVTQSDHNVTMFGCVNEWIQNITALTDFTAIVKENASCILSTDADTPEADSLSVPVIAGSVGGAVAVVCAVVAVVCVIKCKRKGVQKSTSGHPRGGVRSRKNEEPDYDVEIVNSCYESSESTFGQVSEGSYEYIDTRLSMNPTLQVAACSKSSKHAQEDTSDEYAQIRRDR